MAPRRAGASWRSSARCKSRSAFSARERASAISRCSPRNGSRGGSSAGDPPAQNIGEVPEGRGAEACGGARTARYPERRGPVVPRPPSVSRRHDGHALAQGAGGPRGDVRRPRREHGGAPHPQGTPGIPGGPPRRQRRWPARVCLAGSAVPRAPDQERPAAARHRPRALLSRPPARAARVRDSRGRRGAGSRARPRAAGLSRHRRSHPSADPRSDPPAPGCAALPGGGPPSQEPARRGGTSGTRGRARGGAPAGDAGRRRGGPPPAPVRPAVRPAAGGGAGPRPPPTKPGVRIGRFAAGEKGGGRGRIAAGASRLVGGTHALIQEAVKFQRLGLAVIDEQHRFGVEQRAALVEKGDAPDVLLLTATPIPRSLALTLYGDLDVTELRERPPGRGSGKTALRSESAREKIYSFMRSECAAGRQAYVIYPVIEESERADLKAATTMAERLARAFPELRVGLVHGRLNADERDVTMRAFRDNTIHVLVATSVIEVGIDVPNASVMLIEHAERFGLAQLHQLRGRVGRGAAESHCILLSDVPEAAWRPFTETTDGFKSAKRALKGGGRGELGGARQHGGIALRYADLERDLPLLEAARRAAAGIIERDPTLARPEHAAYRERILRRYERGFELFRVG